MTANLIDRLGELIDGIGNPAAGVSVVTKKATSQGVGQTSSPTAKLDGDNHDVSEGERTSENTADVRKAVPGGGAVPDTKNTDRANYGQVQHGVKKAPSDEQLGFERDLESRPTDSPTSSPVNANAGEKYSSDMSFDELYKLACSAGESFLQGVCNGEVVATEKQATQAAVDQAAQAGYAAAAAVAAAPTPEQEKIAQANFVISQAIREGYDRADLVGELLHKYSAYAKQAEGAPPEMSGGLPPEMGSAPPGAGGPGAAPTPPGADGGAPGGPGGPGGEANHDEVINEVLNILMEQGIPIEELLAKAQDGSGEAGGPGGEAGGPGGGAGGEGSSAEHATKAANCRELLGVAKEAYEHLKAGKFRYVPCPKGSKQATARRAAADWIKETIR